VPLTSTLDRMASASVVIALLALPGGIFLVFSRLTGDMNWKYFPANYAWCSAIPYASAVVLLAVHASFAVWVIALLACSATLVGFCVWMATLLARGHVDFNPLWIFLFPAQIIAMVLALLVHSAVTG